MGRIYQNRFRAMGTRFYGMFPDMEHKEGERVFNIIKKEVERIESRISWFRPDSDLSRINDLAAHEPVELDDELLEIMLVCQTCWELTDGLFDITLRPLLEYWRSVDPNHADPSELSEIKERTGQQHVNIDEERSQLTFEREGVEIDLGGFGKGYALEKVKNLLIEMKVKRAFISFGESSILALGDHPAGGDWRIGINDLLKPGSSVYEFKVRDGSVSTSSNFHLTDDGSLEKLSHIIDPMTGKPLESLSSVSVKFSSAVVAEMMSTAFLISSDSKRISDVVSKYDGMEAIRVDYDSGAPKITQFHKS